MVRGHLSPRFLPLGAFGISISRHTEWGVIGPRDNVFTGPAVALDGPGVDRAPETVKGSWLLLRLNYNFLQAPAAGIFISGVGIYRTCLHETLSQLKQTPSQDSTLLAVTAQQSRGFCGQNYPDVCQRKPACGIFFFFFFVSFVSIVYLCCRLAK